MKYSLFGELLATLQKRMDLWRVDGYGSTNELREAGADLLIDKPAELAKAVQKLLPI